MASTAAASHQRSRRMAARPNNTIASTMALLWIDQSPMIEPTSTSSKKHAFAIRRPAARQYVADKDP